MAGTNIYPWECKWTKGINWAEQKHKHQRSYLKGVSQQVLPVTLNKTQELKHKCLTAYVKGRTEMHRYMEIHF